ncbi:hypothetical protein WR25_24943 [Diploscapter pachys]|uniref:Uncharacterized protein n=1 Tax=Diploscapter pachys TaxID=2018661 RepID=A0A2A2J2P6_9BILA|nr:hypothetical protein WR25_24943 [Diploscapter pachys]
MHFMWFISSFLLILISLSSFVKCSLKENNFVNPITASSYEDTDMGADEMERSRRAELAKWKRTFGRNCMLGISGCFTSRQQERLRKYLENVYTPN